MQANPQQSQKKKAKPKKKKQNKPRSGDIIDERFQIVGRPLGKGGMGTVYRIQDPSGVQYALKRLDPALREERNFEKRFRLEYEAAAGLQHPNITQYQELFEADGALHIRMELVEGINLRQLLKQEKILPAPIAVGIARALARALEELHQHRVIHRDLKPENVLLGLDGSIKLSDFGISRVEYASMTRTGTLLGTPRYMSPEQLAGKKGDQIGPESDLYALGMVLYEMLCGKDPYRLRKKAEILEVINVKNQKTPKPLPKDVDSGLAECVMTLLQKDTDNRPSSARIVGEDLGKWAANRRDLRQTLKQWVSQHGGEKVRLAAPKKKRNSFWEGAKKPSVGPTQVPEDEAYIPPQQGGLFPAFVATIAFLVVLWGVGLWLQKDDPRHLKNVVPSAKRSTMAEKGQAPLAIPQVLQAHRKPRRRAKIKKKRVRKKRHRYLRRRRRRVRRRRRKRRYRRRRRRRVHRKRRRGRRKRSRRYRKNR